MDRFRGLIILAFAAFLFVTLASIKVHHARLQLFPAWKRYGYWIVRILSYIGTSVIAAVGIVVLVVGEL